MTYLAAGIAAAVASALVWVAYKRFAAKPAPVTVNQLLASRPITEQKPTGGFGPAPFNKFSAAADAKVAFALASTYDPKLVDLDVMYKMAIPAEPFDPSTCDDETGKTTGNEPSMLIRGKLIRNEVLTPTEYAFLKYQSGGDRTFRADNELGRMVLNS
jgi:hypothetical protein